MNREGPDEQLGFAVIQLRNDIDDLGAAIANLPVRLSTLDNSMDDVRQLLRRVETRSAEVETSTNDLAATVKRLDARVEWLERNIRLEAKVLEAQLDDFGLVETDLARIAEAGNLARSQLLTPGSRSALEATVTARTDAVLARVQHQTAALTASEVLAETSRDDELHLSAIAEFRTAVENLSESRRRIDELTHPAQEAADVLLADESQQLAAADVIAQGEQAWAELRHLLRTRIADAVGAGALLPSWFTTVLGPIPPAADTRSWMDVATSLLAYRLTYAVNDPVVALGPAPGEGETARRRAWYQQLRRQCHELQR